MITDAAIGVENLIAGAGCNGWIRSRPIDNVNGVGPGQIKRPVMGFRCQGYNQIEIVVLKIVQRLRLPTTKVETDFLQDSINKGVALTGSHAS